MQEDTDLEIVNCTQHALSMRLNPVTEDIYYGLVTNQGPDDLIP